MRRYGFIYNPVSGGGAASRRLKRVRKEASLLTDSRFEISRDAAEIQQLVAEMRESCDVVVACGGDGTVREVASALVHTDTPMGIIPVGTGNDLVKSLNIRADITAAFTTLRDGKISRIDTGLCNDHFFINSIGFGFDALTNRYSYNCRKYPGVIRYIFAALKANLKRSDFSVQLITGGDDCSEQLVMVTAANGKIEGGSFWICPEASLTDGLLQLVKIRPVSRWLLPLYLPLVLVKLPHWIPYLETVTVQEIKLKFERPASIHADGEIIESDELIFDLKIVPSSLKVISNLENRG